MTGLAELDRAFPLPRMPVTMVGLAVRLRGVSTLVLLVQNQSILCPRAAEKEVSPPTPYPLLPCQLIVVGIVVVTLLVGPFRLNRGEMRNLMLALRSLWRGHTTFLISP